MTLTGPVRLAVRNPRLVVLAAFAIAMLAAAGDPAGAAEVHEFATNSTDLGPSGGLLVDSGP